MSVPEHVVNTSVKNALVVWAQRKDHKVFSEVLRWAMTGELLLDISDSRLADQAQGFQSGDSQVISSQADNAGKNLLLAFTDQDELTRYRGGPGISLVQPASAVLAQAARDFEGAVIDGRSGGAFIAYSDEILRATDGNPERLGILAEATAGRSLPFLEYLNELRSGPLFIPFETQRDESGAEAGISVPAAVGPDGTSLAVVGTSPAEIWAWNPRCGAQRTGLENVVRAMLANNQTGLVVNPAGPGLELPLAVLTQALGDGQGRNA